MHVDIGQTVLVIVREKQASKVNPLRMRYSMLSASVSTFSLLTAYRNLWITGGGRRV